jgi:hypothetical protein
MLPPLLRKQLEKTCRTMPDSVVDAIRSELANGLTTPQLVARVERRWAGGLYEDDALSSTGRGIENPIAVATKLVQHGDCVHPLCDDGTDLATGEECRTCERAQEDRRPAPQEHVQGAFPVGLPSGIPESAPAPQPRRQRMVAHDCASNVCPNSFPAPVGAPAALCPECRQAEREASNA